LEPPARRHNIDPLGSDDLVAALVAGTNPACDLSMKGLLAGGDPSQGLLVMGTEVFGLALKRYDVQVAKGRLDFDAVKRSSS